MLQDVAIGRSATPFDPDATLCVVVEMSLSSWLVAGLLPLGRAATVEEDFPRRGWTVRTDRTLAR